MEGEISVTSYTPGMQLEAFFNSQYERTEIQNYEVLSRAQEKSNSKAHYQHMKDMHGYNPLDMYS